jgi:hypothetical protein
LSCPGGPRSGLSPGMVSTGLPPHTGQRYARRPFSRSLPLAPSARSGSQLCCPGLFLTLSVAGPRARSRALVTSSRRAAPGPPRRGLVGPDLARPRGGAGRAAGRRAERPISCSQRCTTTKGPGRPAAARSSNRRAGAGPAPPSWDPEQGAARPAAATSAAPRRARLSPPRRRRLPGLHPAAARST